MEATREKLLDAAGAIFAEQGFKSATVRQICKAAGMNVAAVNYYFGDKERLYHDAVREAHRRLSDQFPLPAWPQDASAEVRLHGFIHTMLTRMIGGKSTPWEQRLMLREVLHPTAALRDLDEEYFRPHFEMLLSILRELLPDSVTIEQLRKIGFSIVGQCLYYRIAGDVVDMMTPVNERDQFSVEALAEHITSFTLASLQGICRGDVEPSSESMV